MATKQDALTGAAPAIVTPDPWEELRRFTDARIGLGHCGVSLPVKRWQEFRLAHARARDAVMTPLDEEQVRAGLAAHGLECLSLSSAVADRNEYLTRPDKGRRLSVASRQLLDAWMDAHPGSAPDVSVVICDGLSARAVHENAVPFASRFLEEAAAAGLSAAPVALVKFGRVAVGDDVAALLNARLVIVLVGERPGLSSPDSLGVYMTHAPAPGLTDEARNCISNVRAAGLPVEEAVRKLCYLVENAVNRAGWFNREISEDIVLHYRVDSKNQYKYTVVVQEESRPDEIGSTLKTFEVDRRTGTAKDVSTKIVLDLYE